MYSLNVPVPGEVMRLAADLRPRLTPFDSVRERPSLVCKRFEEYGAKPGEHLENPASELHRLRERLRPALAGTAPFEARVDHVDFFADPPKGAAPVVYLAVDSPGLRRLHERLVAEFGSVHPVLEGPAYDPHVTLARGGTVEAAEALCGVSVEPVVWTVSELHVWDGQFQETAARIGLPT